MCSIIGGTIDPHDPRSTYLFNAASKRGIDDCGVSIVRRNQWWIANHRATPTTEAQAPALRQPIQVGCYALVFNGTISNEVELMGRNPEVDTEVFQHLLNGTRAAGGFLTVHYLAEQLRKIRGSFAIAMTDGVQMFVACNYKPIHVQHHGKDFLFSSLAEHFGPGAQSSRVPPYTVMELTSGACAKIETCTPNKALVIASAGLDSTVCASIACVTHGSESVTLLHFNYGCHATNPETERIKTIAKALQCNLVILPLGCPEMFAGSALTEGSPDSIAESSAGAEYAHEWVPARNLLMIASATAYAEAHGFGHIYLGTNLEEGGAYPDNEQQFIVDMQHALERATNEGYQIQLHAPLGNKMKHEIVRIGTQLKTPFALTWSCYRGGETHCGHCGPCFMRRVAFERNGMKDPVQ